MSSTSVKLRANEKVHQIGQSIFAIDRKYTDVVAIGQGSYGVVCSATDSITKRKVAIKKITPMCKSVEDAKHVLREIRLMRYLGVHENIVKLEDLHVRESSDEIYLIMELFDTDLHRVISSKQQLTENHLKYFFFQLICGVRFLHMNRIIHRDLKPGNLLVSRDCKLRITDFGLARERPIGRVSDDPESSIDDPMTEHVVTRWYRACELMLLPDGLYSYGVDMWACGCILGEMLGRKPMFPGKNFVHQLTLIFDVMGCPKLSETSHIRNGQARKFLDAQIGKRKRPLSSLFPSASMESLALLDDLLVFDPTKRSSAEEALLAPFFDGVGVGSPSLSFPRVDPGFEFSFERLSGSRVQFKELVLQEAQDFKRSKGMIKADGNTARAQKDSEAASIVDKDAKSNQSKLAPSGTATSMSSGHLGATSSKTDIARRHSDIGSPSRLVHDDDSDTAATEDDSVANTYRGHVSPFRIQNRKVSAPEVTAALAAAAGVRAQHNTIEQRPSSSRGKTAWAENSDSEMLPSRTAAGQLSPASRNYSPRQPSLSALLSPNRRISVSNSAHLKCRDVDSNESSSSVSKVPSSAVPASESNTIVYAAGINHNDEYLQHKVISEKEPISLARREDNAYAHVQNSTLRRPLSNTRAVMEDDFSNELVNPDSAQHKSTSQQKRIHTIPQGPTFSVMSWQKKRVSDLNDDKQKQPEVDKTNPKAKDADKELERQKELDIDKDGKTRRQSGLANLLRPTASSSNRTASSISQADQKRYSSAPRRAPSNVKGASEDQQNIASILHANPTNERSKSAGRPNMNR